MDTPLCCAALSQAVAAVMRGDVMVEEEHRHEAQQRACEVDRVETSLLGYHTAAHHTQPYAHVP